MPSAVTDIGAAGGTGAAATSGGSVLESVIA